MLQVLLDCLFRSDDHLTPLEIIQVGVKLLASLFLCFAIFGDALTLKHDAGRRPAILAQIHRSLAMSTTRHTSTSLEWLAKTVLDNGTVNLMDNLWLWIGRG